MFGKKYIQGFGAMDVSRNRCKVLAGNARSAPASTFARTAMASGRTQPDISLKECSPPHRHSLSLVDLFVDNGYMHSL